jgi:two-component system phosphate regulon sensor histidine kinase PhoR
MFRGIRWRIAAPYVLLTIVVTVGLTIYVSDQVRQARLADLETQLLAEARLLAARAQPLLAGEQNPEELDTLAKSWAELLAARVTVIAADGLVLGESHEDRTQMENHGTRVEVRAALANGSGTSIRLSQTLGYSFMYAAQLVKASAGSTPTGVVRVALPLQEIDASVNRVRRSIMGAGALAALLAAGLALLIAERTARPVRRLTRVAERMAEGDLSSRLLPSARDEIGKLTHAFSNMADRLRAQMDDLAEERGHLSAVLDHMADGVIITDGNGRVELINAAAARLFGASEERALGRTFAQVVPHHQLIDLWNQCLEQGEEQVETVEIAHYGLFLQAFVTPFHEVSVQGYLVILQDLTSIRRLETVRRDFISNVSHELRTPLAGIKALVDTLRSGAIKDPPAAKRFLKRMDVEVDALTQMVAELLELSRIESGQVPLRLSPVSVADVVLPPTERLRALAERGGVDLAVDLPAEFPRILADVERTQQVLTNLLHNAVKFTPPGGTILVDARVVEGEAVLSVQDTGVGIPAEDLPRIFERFYKADRARSGGGTGLGLAIAKHVIQGHGGRIWVDSVEGEGSTFYFTLPVAE